MNELATMVASRPLRLISARPSGIGCFCAGTSELDAEQFGVADDHRGVLTLQGGTH